MNENKKTVSKVSAFGAEWYDKRNKRWVVKYNLQIIAEDGTWTWDIGHVTTHKGHWRHIDYLREAAEICRELGYDYKRDHADGYAISEAHRRIKLR